jgi:hypothetical protein
MGLSASLVLIAVELSFPDIALYKDLAEATFSDYEQKNESAWR